MIIVYDLFWNLFSFFVFFLAGCGLQKSQKAELDSITEEAELLSITEHDGYDEVFIMSPKGNREAHYVLIDRNDTLNRDIPEGAEVIKVPLEKTILDSEVYAGAIEELGAAGTVRAMFDGAYVTSPALKEKLTQGTLKDLGPTSSPNLEKILALAPDAIFLSYFEGMQTQSLDKLGIPLIKMYDLQEPTPLGRAEWIRFLGRLSGRGKEADSIFSAVKKNYNEIKRNASIKNSPKILTETIYEGVWNVPGGRSYQATLIKDAGGRYFKENDNTPVSLKLSPEQVLLEGIDSDIWLIRYFGDANSLKAILKSDPVYSGFKPLKEGKIYYSDTSLSGLFREFPFHPDRLLMDYNIIFKGGDDSRLKYFKKLDL